MTWEDAARQHPRRPGEDALSWVERLCKAMGVQIGGPRRMPDAPGKLEWEQRQNAQKAALLERQPGEEG